MLSAEHLSIQVEEVEALLLRLLKRKRILEAEEEEEVVLEVGEGGVTGQIPRARTNFLLQVPSHLSHGSLSPLPLPPRKSPGQKSQGLSSKDCCSWTPSSSTPPARPLPPRSGYRPGKGGFTSCSAFSERVLKKAALALNTPCNLVTEARDSPNLRKIPDSVRTHVRTTLTSSIHCKVCLSNLFMDM